MMGTALFDILARRIERDGPMSVSDYVSAALTDREHGYYMGRDPLGREGDFITAPEMSQMFGELLGLWCVDVWRRLGSPTPMILTELGPGRGTLMRDALRAIRTTPECAAAVSVHFVEVSPVLQALQAQAVPDAVWHETAADLPTGPMVVLANEFMDALPVRQFERRPDGWHERRVVLAPTPGFVTDGFPARMDGLVPPALESAESGAVMESCPAGLSLMEEMARRLTVHPGAFLIVDYGPSRSAEGASLQAVRKHRQVDVFDSPGESDLTAHVDFDHLSLRARAVGAEVYGPVAQGDFLNALGLETRARRLKASADARQSRDIDRACERLTAPQAMGRLFKALSVVSPGCGAPAGFST